MNRADVSVVRVDRVVAEHLVVIDFKIIIFLLWTICKLKYLFIVIIVNRQHGCGRPQLALVHQTTTNVGRDHLKNNFT